MAWLMVCVSCLIHYLLLQVWVTQHSKGSVNQEDDGEAVKYVCCSRLPRDI